MKLPFKREMIPTVLLPIIQSYRYKGKSNFYENRVPEYFLPDIFTCGDGTRVDSVFEWENNKRNEILQFFQDEVYGRTLNLVIPVQYEVIEEAKKVFDGKAFRYQIRFVFNGNGHSIEALLLAYVPNNGKTNHPVILGYNLYGNQSTTKDEEVLFSPSTIEAWHRVKSYKRGFMSNRWCYEDAISRGFAVATMCYTDICPDSRSFKVFGAANLFKIDGKANDSDWQTIGLWSWGSSRICDFLLTQPWVNPDQIAIFGHSRLGKAALWTGAQDSRFKVVISNESGGGGASLAKRYYGENVSMLVSNYPHWFSKAYAKYANNEKEMCFDQHELLSLIAPRHLYVCSASKDLPSDPKGEFLATLYAGEVWKLYGLQGLPSSVFPSTEEPLMGDIGYHVRSGFHGVTEYDWNCWMDFCEKCYKSE